MMRLLAAVFVIAVSAGGTDDDVVQRAHARITGGDMAVVSCRDVGADGGELGITTFRFGYVMNGTRPAGSSRYTGRVTFSLGEVVITMPKSIAWRRMTGKERERAEALRRAIYHHEAGHIRVGEAVRDQLNAHDTIVAPDAFAFKSAADALGREGFALFLSEQREYDALTDHGRSQHVAPGVLAGADTVLICG
jgi:hypothetical protein